MAGIRGTMCDRERCFESHLTILSIRDSIMRPTHVVCSSDRVCLRMIWNKQCMNVMRLNIVQNDSRITNHNLPIAFIISSTTCLSLNLSNPDLTQLPCHHYFPRCCKFHAKFRLVLVRSSHPACIFHMKNSLRMITGRFCIQI